MTATLYSNRPADRVAPRSRVVTPPHRADGAANYAIRRTAAAFLLAALVAITVFAASAMVGAIGDVGGRPAAASDITSAVGMPIRRVHVAQPGDTLWSIADRYRGEVDQDRFVDALIDVNGGTVIQIGQAVRLP